MTGKEQGKGKKCIKEKFKGTRRQGKGLREKDKHLS